MQESLRAQKNAGSFEGSKEFKKVIGLREMQEGLRTLKNAGRFEGSEE